MHICGTRGRWVKVYSLQIHKTLSPIFYLWNVQSGYGNFLQTFYIIVLLSYTSMSYCVKLVIIPLHILHICNHHKHDVSSVSRYEAHEPLGFLVPFAIRFCYGIAIADSYDHLYMLFLYICTRVVYVISVRIFEFEIKLNLKNRNTKPLYLGTMMYL